MYFEAVFSFYVLLYHFVGHSFLGLYSSALLAILSSGTFPSPSPNSTFTLICPSGFLWESSTTVSTWLDTTGSTSILPVRLRKHIEHVLTFAFYYRYIVVVFHIKSRAQDAQPTFRLR